MFHVLLLLSQCNLIFRISGEANVSQFGETDKAYVSLSYVIE